MDGLAAYQQVVDELILIDNVIPSKWFGMPCLLSNKYTFAAFFEGDLVVKLDTEALAQTLALEGVKPFDPSGKGRPMKEWVQVPHRHASQWIEIARQALAYVRSLPPKR